MKNNITKMYKLQEQIALLEKECDTFGKEIYGNYYEGCDLNEGVLTVFEECGHEFDSEEYYFNKEGEEV